MQVNETSNRAVARWLMLGVIMTIIQVALGGITRLTGSGLSITEWDVITGTLPPLNETQWMTEFAKYRQTPQFQLLNFEFTLSDFKFIFFWEWFHRLWARLIGLVFAGGFIWFLVKRYFKKDMIQPLVYLFLLGALQGAVGWIMVASGLTGDAVYVKPTRLALHFIFALGLLCYTWWFALDLLIKPTQIFKDVRVHRSTKWLLVLLVVQLIYGALMAGHKAANVASTWPQINGEWIPANLFTKGPFFRSLIEDKITIHFIHRTLAYIILIWILVWTRQIRQLPGSMLFHKVKHLPLLLTLVQVLLGIFSVLTSKNIIPGKWGTFEWMAQLHQLTGMFLLLSLVTILYLIRGRSMLAPGK